MQKITPFLWYEDKAEDAMNLYVSVFKNSKIERITRVPEGPLEEPMKGMEGKVLGGEFILSGQKFTALDGGAYYKHNPAVSLMVCLPRSSEVEEVFNKLSVGGSVIMPLDKYPFSERYGWLQDKYGVPWQVILWESPQPIIPSFLFTGELFGRVEEALDFWTSIFRDSSINQVSRYEPGEGDIEGKVKFSSFSLEGQLFAAMESSKSKVFAPTGAISQLVECESQAEIDYYWDKLREGGDESAQICGWLTDKFGFSWQVVPAVLAKMISDPNSEKVRHVLKAIMPMKKLIIADLERAYKG
jgi:predicted 3-demethylubiquinone-9 3-methyltransferase (glyoxalase superfamily)